MAMGSMMDVDMVMSDVGEIYDLDACCVQTVPTWYLPNIINSHNVLVKYVSYTFLKSARRNILQITI